MNSSVTTSATRTNDLDEHELPRAVDSSTYNEFLQFQRFQQLFRSNNSSPVDPAMTKSSTQGVGPYTGPYAGSYLPQANPTYDYFSNDNKLHGFLSQQFPTIANPAPLGLCAFALTTWVLSMYNVGAFVDAAGPNGVVLGLAFFYGGIAQLLAGMWEFRTGNTFGALAFSSYGGFWLSYAALSISAFDFLSGYADAPQTLNNALGVYLFAWTLFTFFMFISSHRTSVVLVLLFFFLTITFLLLTISQFLNHVPTKQAGGGFGILTAAIAWYGGFAGLLNRQTSLFVLPVGDLKGYFDEREKRLAVNSSRV